MGKKTKKSPLENEINFARKSIVTDGYDMSVGEVMNLYRDFELEIDPVFQRLFRWDQTRKSRFIESLLLGIPIPPIFVYQDADGVWELIDGLQRLSTILEFAGELRSSEEDTEKIEFWEPSEMTGTKLLPSLDGKVWSLHERERSIGRINQIAIKRARLRVEILKSESDEDAKFELFQRLNTGGVPLSEQEVRNCVAVMINKSLYAWLIERSTYAPFVKTIAQTGTALEKQADIELVLRMLAFRHIRYDGRMDVHEYLDDALLQLARNKDIDWKSERKHFEAMFSLLELAFHDKAFRKWDGSEFKGKFLMSLYEVIGYGVSGNLEKIQSLGNPKQFVREKAKTLWSESTFNRYSGAGIRGTTRLAKLLPFALSYFEP